MDDLRKFCSGEGVQREVDPYKILNDVQPIRKMYKSGPGRSTEGMQKGTGCHLAGSMMPHSWLP